MRDLGFTLNGDQSRALAGIEESIKRRQSHLLIGPAGTGKTALLQEIAVRAIRRDLRVVLTGPTHASVGVLEKKLKAAGIFVPCRTIQSLLGLKPKYVGDRVTFVRGRGAQPIEADIVIVDETSQLGEELTEHCQRWLAGRAVIFSGDDAQLNPVGEDISPTFALPRVSRLETPQRQAMHNPILQAAWTVRASQGGPADWSWIRRASSDGHGIYLPRDPDEWLEKAFTSPAFEADTTAHRYVCWTNRRMADVNAKVRGWIYGDAAIVAPFVRGERALVKDPLVRDKTVLLQTGQEVTVVRIDAGHVDIRFPKRGLSPAFDVTVPVWEMRVRDDDGAEVDAVMPSDDAQFRAAVARLADEGRQISSRWADYHAFRERFLNAQAIYAQTIHTAQGSTHGNTFLDVPEIRRWTSVNLLEAQRGLYVGMTRPSRTLTLVGAAL